MIPAFEREPYLRELEVEVTGVGKDDAGPYAVLSDTVLYPEGGGQPADHGYLGAIRIIGVQRLDGEIRHYLENAAATGSATLTLDWKRRFDHMQQHTAQHLITAIAADEFGWETTSFHLGVRSSDIELDVGSIADPDLVSLEERAATVIHEARPVTTRRAAPEELASGDIRSRGLPAGHDGDVRLVEIAGIDCNTCGGTHVGTTAEIGAIKLLGTESMRGGTRLHWVAGARVRTLLAAHETRAASLREIFETSDDEVLQVADSKLARLKQAERQIKRLRAELAEETARRLESSEGAIVDAHFDGADSGFLQSIARQMTALRASRACLLTATSDSGSFFVLSRGTGFELDLESIGAQLATLLDGRGGGSAELFQGKAGTLERRPEAVALLENAIGPGSV